MKSKQVLLLLLIGVFFVSCSEKFEQGYANYAEFIQAPKTDKWLFPDIMKPDAYDIKNESRLDSATAFGMFSYKTDSLYDVLFEDSTKSIAFGVFCDKTQEIFIDKPAWFEDPKVHVYDGWKAVKIDDFYITQDKKNKKIYFILNK